MEIESKSDAQIRVDRINSFRDELSYLINNRVIDIKSDTLEKIDNYHNSIISTLIKKFNIDSDDKSKNLSLGMKVVSFLSAIALSISLFFMFYQFWGYLNTFWQVIILVSIPIITLLATIYLYYRDSSGYFSKILASITLVSFILNISMLSTIFNLAPSSNALLLWAFFAFILAYATDTRMLLGFAIMLFSAFLSAQMGSIGGIYWIGFGEYPENFFLPSLILFFVPIYLSNKKFDDFNIIYRVFSMLLFFIPVLILSHYGDASYLNIPSNRVEIFYQIVGFLFSLIVIIVGIRWGWSDMLNSGNIFFSIFLYTKFYDWWWDIMPKYLFFFIIGISTFLLLILFKKLRDKRRV